MDKNIVLIGFPGVGKSSIGKKVAEILNFKFIDTDEEIVKIDKRPITKIFRESGEDYFRELEKKVVKDVSKEKKAVISTGGGVVLFPENIENLKKNGILFLLTASFEVIFKRLLNEQSRPLLLHKDRWELAQKIRNLLKRRAFQYVQTSNVIDVTCYDVNKIAQKIVNVYLGKEKIYLVGLVGKYLEKTLSPLMHNTAFHYQNLPFFYMCFETDDLDSLVKRVKKLGIKGFNVTYPYKIEIIKYIDQLSPEAKKIKAINTVLNQNGKLIGFNTDAIGSFEYFQSCLKKEKIYLNPQNTIIAVIGTGGASRAIVYQFKKYFPNIIVFGRKIEKINNLVKDFGVEGDLLINFNKYKWDVLIHCTPVGMANPSQSIIPSDYIIPNKIVYDIVYFPLETKLLKMAKTKNCLTIDGLGMLIYQGAYSYEIWTGKKAPRYLMEKVTRNYLKKVENENKDSPDN